MPSTSRLPSRHPLAAYVHHLEAGGALLPESPAFVPEVVGILKSYGVVLDAYWRNLVYIAEHQFLELFPFFKYFNGEFSWAKLFRHWNHDRINFEYAEYCMRVMLWHGSGGLDAYLDTPEFSQLSERAIQAKLAGNPAMQFLHRCFPEFLPEQVRQLAYYSGLGQFWQVMSKIFLTLSDCYDRGEVTTIAEIVDYIQAGLVAAAGNPITYTVTLANRRYNIVPRSAGLTFLPDVAVPYVEAVFLRGTPFFGVVSYNAQVFQIPVSQDQFTYGALYADPLPIGGAGIPPTLLMQDMRHYLPDYLLRRYQQQPRGEIDLRVKICESFQKSMLCVTTAAIRGTLPYPLTTRDSAGQKANRTYLESWLDRLATSCLTQITAS